MANIQNSKVGDKVFVDSHGGWRDIVKNPVVRTIISVTTRQITLDNGTKFNINTGHVWGNGNSRYGDYITPYTEEEYTRRVYGYELFLARRKAQQLIGNLHDRITYIGLEGEKLNQFIAALEIATGLLNKE